MNPDRDLIVTRLIDAPRHRLYAAWTEPAALMPWFCPRPWVVTDATLDPRPGGAMEMIMRGPDGASYPFRGVYLEVVPDERIVWTTAFASGWETAVSSGAPPMVTVTVTLADEEGKTRYTARCQHWSVADREAHEAMGFHDGWGAALDQLEAMVTGI